MTKIYHRCFINSYKINEILDWQLEKSFDTEKHATALGTQEKIINRELMSHKYFRFWDLSRQIEIKTNYIRYKDFHDARFDLQY